MGFIRGRLSKKLRGFFMHKATEKEMAALCTYLFDSVKHGSAGLYDVKPRSDVTALMYFFWDEANAASVFPRFEGALLETWRHCGLLKTVLVTNTRHKCLVDFSTRFENVEIQIESSLIPGQINTMSIDCNSRLHTRFETDYVLIVQDDGFPLRAGLDDFIGKGYDFIGSPYCRALPLPNLLTKILNFCPSNGGFSLRTRKMCALASKLWRKHYAHKEFFVPEMSEDLFYTITLPKHFMYWLKRKQAPSIVAGQFSYEGVFPLYSNEMPFGFHTATGFARLARKFDFLTGERK